MSDTDDIDDFLGRWRERWPEWRIARVFVPEAQQVDVDAWFALIQEWTEAAWAGADPTPGFAKLGWWQDELLGWAKGARRHPLGRVLQRRPAPWSDLAAHLAILQRVRESVRAHAAPEAIATTLAPLIETLDRCERALFATAATSEAPTREAPTREAPTREAPTREASSVSVAGDPRCLLSGWALREIEGDAETAQGRDWARQLSQWPATRASTRPRRIHDALVLGRLQRRASGRENQVLPPLAALWRSWRAARG